VLIFNRLGRGGRMAPEAAARFHGVAIDGASFAEHVPERLPLGTRPAAPPASRARIRVLPAPGELALLEGALGRRFVDFFEGRMPIAGRRGAMKGAEAVLLVRGSEQVWKAASDDRHAELADDGTYAECSAAEPETAAGWPSVAQFCEQTLLMERSSRVG
jgi:hypothetical protein